MPAPALREQGIPEIVELPPLGAMKESTSGVASVMNGGALGPTIRLRRDSDRSVTSRFADPDVEARTRQHYEHLARQYAPGDDETVGSFGGYQGA